MFVEATHAPIYLSYLFALSLFGWLDRPLARILPSGILGDGIDEVRLLSVIIDIDQLCIHCACGEVSNSETNIYPTCIVHAWMSAKVLCMAPFQPCMCALITERMHV